MIREKTHAHLSYGTRNPLHVHIGTSTAIEEIRVGYSVKRFDNLVKSLNMTAADLAQLARISHATMHRRKNKGKFSPEESDKIYRIEKLYKTALDVLESDEHVRTWLKTKLPVFGGKTPLEYADTLPGSEEVEKVLRRMEQGIPL